MEHAHHQLHGTGRDPARDPQGPGRQQLRLRAAGELPPPVRPRRRPGGEPGAVGDGGVQAPEALAQRRPLQEDIGLVHRLQEHRFQSSQRVKTMRGTWLRHTSIKYY